MPPPIPAASTLGFAKASAYDAHRPSYPAEAVQELLSQLHLAGDEAPPGTTKILDLAAGTGKFTELLAARPEKYEIVAVEPHDEMRGVLEGKVSAGGLGDGRVKVIKGEAANMPQVESQSVDGVVVAQAFHWFADEAALEEIYRVLVPGGSLGMIWNLEDYNSSRSAEPTTEWEGKLKDIVWSRGNENPRLRHEKWREVFDKQLESTPLTIQAADPRFSLPIGEETFAWTTWLTEEDLTKRFFTLSQNSILEGEALRETQQKVAEILKGPDVERDGDGKIGLHGRTVLAWTTAIPGAPLKSGG